MVIFIRCSEIYTPNIDPTTEALVVEGLITNGAGPFNIKLSKTVLYNSDSIPTQKFVLGAILTVVDNENHIFALKDGGKGNYSMPLTFQAKIGNSYKLHIKTTDGNIYESNSQELLPPQIYDSIRGYNTTQTYLNVDNELNSASGADIRVDLFSSVTNADLMPACRFNSNITLQYNYTINDIDPVTGKPIIDWYWFKFGYASYDLNGSVNITEKKFTTASAIIKNHSLGFMPFVTGYYGFLTPPVAYLIYYLRVNQFTMNDDSYNFYNEANNQLAANGKIFDPITAQLYGNMKCINNSSKVALGLFEVSSVTQTAFVVNRNSSNNALTIKKVPYLDIPKSVFKEYKIWNALPPLPAKDSLAYIPIPLPTWWYHN